jgi:hypothetical protein
MVRMGSTNRTCFLFNNPITCTLITEYMFTFQYNGIGGGLVDGLVTNWAFHDFFLR